MSATSGLRPSRDFSDAAIWRGSAVAIIVGSFLSTVAPQIWTRVGSAQFDLVEALFVLSLSLQAAFNPAALVLAGCAMLVMVVIGYFVMATFRGDHTTYAAAMIIGARTAAIGIGIVLFFGLIFSRGAILTSYPGEVSDALASLVRFALACTISLGVGAITGLAARIAAGAPTVESTQMQADASAG